tara:strand:+ start:9668 stop:9922 length:255 start_codon:yes stop_codon:yes gene_type:complete
MKSHIDAMDQMLNEIFKKVFWEPLEQKEREQNFCPDCGGWGYVEREVFKPMGFDRDVGCIDVDQIDCPECVGTGQNLNQIAEEV